MSSLNSPAITSTELYSWIPNEIGSSRCECLDSLLRRLAVAHTVTYPALMKHIYATYCSTKGPFREAQHHVRSLLFNSPLIPVIAEATGRNEVNLCTLNNYNNLISFKKCMDVTMRRHCPVCVAEHPFPNAWYPIIWCVGPVEACPVHHVQLVSSQCGYPRDRWLSVVKRCFVPGVCGYCGSIGFQCSKPVLQDATNLQIWVANQVGALVAAATRGETFDPRNIKAVLRNVVTSHWGGLSAAARSLGVKDTLIRDNFKPGSPFGLQFLLALCSASGTDILSVLRGRTIVDSTIREAYIVQPRWSSRQPTKGVSEDEVETLISSDPLLTLVELAARLGVSTRWFRQHFPHQSAEVAARYKARLSKSGWRRLLASGRVMREAAIYLEQIGLTFNKDNIEKYFGLSIWWDKDEELYERIRAKVRSKHLGTVGR